MTDVEVLNSNRTILMDKQEELPSASRSVNRLGRFKTIPFVRQWWFELACIVLMLLSIFATTLTLALHQDQPLPQWPLSISINTLLSIYGLILKGAMLLVVAEGLGQVKWLWFHKVHPLRDIELFDSASRGPKGALDLLWASRSRVKISLLPIVGAVLTLLAIGIDPFTQQIVRYYTCRAKNPHGTQATISRVSNYSYPNTVSLFAFNPFNLDSPTQGAFYAGLFGANIPDPAFKCPSGECDFHNHYFSTAICARCEDVTSHIKITKGQVPSPEQSSSIKGQNYSLPSGLVLSRPYDNPNFGEYFVAQNVYDLKDLLEPYSRSVDVEMISFSPSDAAFGTTRWSQDSREVGAAHCGLYPCVEEYSASVHDGRLNETIWDSIPLGQSRTNISSFLLGDALPVEVTVRIGCLSEREKSQLLSQGYDLAANQKFLNLGLNHPHGLPTACLYMYDPRLWYSFISNFVNGEETGSPILAGNITTYSDQPFVGPPALHAFYNQGNITFSSVMRVFNTIAKSLTSHMRHENANNGSEGAKPVIGVVVGNTTCVAVRWPWLILPLCLFLATLIFFVTTLYRSMKYDRNIWKSSSLALLFHGLDNQTRGKYGTLATTNEMEKAANDLRVRLQLNDEGWTFSEIDFSSRFLSQGYKVRRGK